MERHYDSFAGRKDAYSSPRIEVLEISVEKGFVDSQGYGDPGAAGGDLDYGNDYDL